MSNGTPKYEIFAWVIGLLASFALISGILAIYATVVQMNSAINQIGFFDFLGPSIQVLLSIVMIYGSFELYRKSILGKKLLIVTMLIILGLSFMDAAKVFYSIGDEASVVANLLFHILPLSILLPLVYKLKLEEEK